MGKKITRKQLKRNDLVETMGRTVDYVSHHRRGVTEGIVAAAVVVLLIGGFLVLRAYRESQAGKDLSAGLAALDVPIAGTPAPRSRGRGPSRARACRPGARPARAFRRDRAPRPRRRVPFGHAGSRGSREDLRDG